ncbi:MAG: thiamine phosphate synthase, partial [Rubripirellula sp.]
RADLAVAADVDGVHVGQDELPVAAAREIVGERMIGVSTHSLEQAREAAKDGADYIGCGPVFPSATKTFDRYLGTEWLKEVAKEIDLPAFAIGGIDLENLDQVIDAGVRRVAVTAAIHHSDQPAEVAERLHAMLVVE